MVTHEVVADEKIRVIMPASGGSQGGNRINEKVLSVLTDIYGKEQIELTKQRFPKEWHSLQARIERQKKRFQYGKRFIISIPTKIEDHLQHILKKGIPPKGIIFNDDFDIVIKEEGVHSIFDATKTNILYDAQKVLSILQKQEGDAYKLDYILMVGGFSQSKIIQQAIMDKFQTEGCKVILPREADVAVLKGAVLFGHCQNEIVSRIARRTYGFGCSQPFNADIHDVKYRFRNKDNKVRCNKIFSAMVEKGDIVEVSSRKEEIYYLLREQTELTISLYCMDRKPRKDAIEYTDGKDVTKLGQVTIATKSDKAKAERKVVVSMFFGQTEITVEAYDETSNQRVHAIVDLMT